MIHYEPWLLRGYTGPTYQVYVEIKNSHSIKELRQVKDQINNPPHTGLMLVENKSKALMRLGWEKLDDGLYYRLFE